MATNEQTTFSGKAKSGKCKGACRNKQCNIFNSPFWYMDVICGMFVITGLVLTGAAMTPGKYWMTTQTYWIVSLIFMVCAVAMAVMGYVFAALKFPDAGYQPENLDDLHYVGIMKVIDNAVMSSVLWFAMVATFRQNWDPEQLQDFDTRETAVWFNSATNPTNIMMFVNWIVFSAISFSQFVEATKAFVKWATWDVHHPITRGKAVGGVDSKATSVVVN